MSLSPRVIMRRIDFDAKRLNRAKDRAERAMLFRAGGFVRATMRNSMRRSGVSKPGQPPRVHTAALKGGIAFAVEQRRGRVVIGATLRSGSRVPRSLEHGGYTKARTRGLLGTRVRLQKVAARPFAAPALVKATSSKNWGRVFGRHFR